MISDIVTALSFLSLGDGENNRESIRGQPPPKDARIIDILGDYFWEDGTGDDDEAAAGQVKVVAEATECGSNSCCDMQCQSER
ncbi:hypothetical protein MLD38_021708 [Melastoma candidum]|nr:hypothetical protein MLD38_021708 [Melastoma candidum]